MTYLTAEAAAVLASCALTYIRSKLKLSVWIRALLAQCQGGMAADRRLNLHLLDLFTTAAGFIRSTYRILCCVCSAAQHGPMDARDGIEMQFHLRGYLQACLLSLSRFFFSWTRTAQMLHPESLGLVMRQGETIIVFIHRTASMLMAGALRIQDGHGPYHKIIARLIAMLGCATSIWITQALIAGWISSLASILLHIIAGVFVYARLKSVDYRPIPKIAAFVPGDLDVGVPKPGPDTSNGQVDSAAASLAPRALAPRSQL